MAVAGGEYEAAGRAAVHGVAREACGAYPLVPSMLLF